MKALDRFIGKNKDFKVYLEEAIKNLERKEANENARKLSSVQ